MLSQPLKIISKLYEKCRFISNNTSISPENGAKYLSGDFTWVIYATGARAIINLTFLAACGNREENIKNIVVPIECPIYIISPFFCVTLLT